MDEEPKTGEDPSSEVEEERSRLEQDGPDGAEACETGAAGMSEAEAALRAELQEANDRVVRLMADFENLRRRTAERELSQRTATVGEAAGVLLPVKDDLERALKADDGPGLRQGVGMVLSAFAQAMERLGVTEVPAEGCPFDPRRHQAIAREAKEGVEEGTVIEVFQTGYALGDRLIRPALVKVASDGSDGA